LSCQNYCWNSEHVFSATSTLLQVMKLTSPHPNRQGEDARFIFFENGKVQIAKLFAIYFYLKKQKQKFQFENFKLKRKLRQRKLDCSRMGILCWHFLLIFSHYYYFFSAAKVMHQHLQIRWNETIMHKWQLSNGFRTYLDTTNVKWLKQFHYNRTQL
jgi:hypothetical protein